MLPDHSSARPTGAGCFRLSLLLALAAALHGCAAPAQPAAPPAPPPASVAVAAPAPAAPPAAEADAQRVQHAVHPVVGVLAYADRIRGLPAPELAQEISRLGDGADSAVRLMQLAMALGQSRVPANGARAQALLQRVLGLNVEEARALHPLARLLSGQLAEARRADEQLERQGQQLRDAQRRIEQLHERLEAVRAIERSLPSRPAPSARP